jgi:hypothetical protein
MDARLLACWRNGAFGAVTGSVVGAAAGALDSFAALAQASKHGPLQASIKAALARDVASRSVGCGAVFALYQTVRCGLRASQNSLEFPEGLQIAVAAAVALPPAYAVRGLLPTSLLLIGMDGLRYVLPGDRSED